MVYIGGWHRGLEIFAIFFKSKYELFPMEKGDKKVIKKIFSITSESQKSMFAGINSSIFWAIIEVIWHGFEHVRK